MPEFQPNKSLYVYSTYGATYPMHFHSHCEIMYITSGDVKTEVDGREYVAHTGEVIFVAPISSIPLSAVRIFRYSSCLRASPCMTALPNV